MMKHDSRRSLLVTGGLMVLVFLLTGIGTAVAMGPSKSGDSSTASKRSDSRSSQDTPDGQEQETAPDGTDDEAPSTPTNPDSVTCWDGSVTELVTDCPILSGPTGMRWVFPTLDARYDSCAPTRLYDGKVTAIHCKLPLDSAAVAGVTFSEFGSAAETEQHYLSKYGEPRRRGDRRIFGPTLIGTSQYQTSAVFADGRRWSVTAAASTPEDASDALDRVRMRSIAEMNAQVGPPPP
jgi:hypothetical protein